MSEHKTTIEVPRFLRRLSDADLEARAAETAAAADEARARLRLIGEAMKALKPDAT